MENGDEVDGEGGGDDEGNEVNDGDGGCSFASPQVGVNLTEGVVHFGLSLFHLSEIL